MDSEMKTQVLLATAEERNRAMHIMRERVHKTCIWILGIFLAVAGWIIQGKVTLSSSQKGFLIAVVAVAIIVTRSIYLRDIENGFKGQQKVLARIETALKLYEPGFFDDGENGLFPYEWKHAGTENGKGRFFKNYYWMLYIGAIVLSISLLAQGVVY